MVRKTLTTQSIHLERCQAQAAQCLERPAVVLAAGVVVLLATQTAAAADHLVVAEDAPPKGDQQALGRAVLGVGRAVLPPVRAQPLKRVGQV